MTESGVMARHGRLRRLRRLEGLDPVRDFHEIYRATVTLEFPWDMKQALSFALFRTYAVPGIGERMAARILEVVGTAGGGA